MFIFKDISRNCLPLGNSEFSDIHDEKMIYVGEIALIYENAVESSHIFFSPDTIWGMDSH